MKKFILLASLATTLFSSLVLAQGCPSSKGDANPEQSYGLLAYVQGGLEWIGSFFGQSSPGTEPRRPAGSNGPVPQHYQLALYSQIILHQQMIQQREKKEEAEGKGPILPW